MCTTAVLTAAVILGLMPYLVKHLDLGASLYQPDYSLEWVQSLQSQLAVQQLTQAERYPTSAQMKMLWQTPMMHVNIAALVGPVDVPKFNARLSAAVLHEFNNLIGANPDKLQKDGVSGNDANQVFFEWQKRGGWSALRATKEIRMLEEFFQTAVDKYFKTVGTDPVRSKIKKIKIKI